MTGGAADLYLARIGYEGPLAPSLAVLRDIVGRHAEAIPFENLDVQARRGIRLDLPSLQQKLLQQRRGGYCFEHNTLLLHTLRALGFATVGLGARVRRGRPPDFVPPRTHMLLRIDLPEGAFLADVGYGGLTPTAPLALETGREQPTPHETYRLVPAGDEIDLQARLGGDWADLYRFSLAPQAATDYEVANWFTSTHPESLFVRHLVASRPAPGRRYTLFNDRFSIRHLDGRVERRRVTDAATLAGLLARHFGIAGVPAADLAAISADLAARPAAGDPFESAERG